MSTENSSSFNFTYKRLENEVNLLLAMKQIPLEAKYVDSHEEEYLFLKVLENEWYDVEYGSILLSDQLKDVISRKIESIGFKVEWNSTGTIFYLI